MNYINANKSELEQEYQKVLASFDDCKAQKLSLNMARGKPSKMQLDAVSDLLLQIQFPEECIIDGVDTRNYGELSGLKCAKEY